jgi:hypothetical protein
LNNEDETHYKVAMVQADGFNQLATKTAIRGDPGDPFPGTSNKTAFTATTTPNSKSYGGLDTGVSITNISVSGGKVIMDIGIPIQTFFPVYNQGEPGHGIGGYDLRSSADISFPFDYTSSGKLDHIVLYRPGVGTCWILANNGGFFSPVFKQGDPGGGIGGFDLKSVADRGLAFDYNSSGKLDHLVFYRPGKGAIFILRNNNGTLSPVYAKGDDGHFGGIGGYDIRSPADRIFAFDYNSSGRLDHLCCYRPGTGTMWILRHTNGTFAPVYAQGDPGQGIGGYDLKSPNDRAFAFDWDSSGRMDHIALYRPGTGTFWCLRNNQGAFSPVMSVGDPGNGIGGYDLRSPADVAFAYDWDHGGIKDHVALYRPGTGTFWVLKHLGGTNFSPVYNRGDPGDGVGGYDLKSAADKIYAFDYEHSGTEDYLVCYRQSGTGTFWILKRG